MYMNNYYLLVCIHIHNHVCIHICTYIHICIYIHTHGDPTSYVYTSIFTDSLSCIHFKSCIHSYIYIHSYMYTSTRIVTQLTFRIYIHHIYKFTFICTSKSWSCFSQPRSNKGYIHIYP